MSILRMTNGNCVVGGQPAPDDLFVMVLVAGRVALVSAISDYGSVLSLAEGIAAQTPPAERPCTVKVLGASLSELLNLQGISMEEFGSSIEGDDEEWRALAVETCRDVLLNGAEPQARREAFEFLDQLGEIRS